MTFLEQIQSKISFWWNFLVAGYKNTSAISRIGLLADKSGTKQWIDGSPVNYFPKHKLYPDPAVLLLINYEWLFAEDTKSYTLCKKALTC